MRLIRQLKFILNTINVKLDLGLILLIFIGTLLESLSIGLVIPFIAFLIKGNSFTHLPFIQYFGVLSEGTSSHEMQSLKILAAIFGVYFLKASFLTFTTQRQSKFVHSVELSLSEKTLESYLSHNYDFFLKNSASKFIQNIYTNSNNLAIYLNSSLHFFSDSFLLIVIAVILFFFQPVRILIISTIIGLLLFAFLKFTRTYNKKWGAVKSSCDQQRIKLLTNSFQIIKDIKLYNKEVYFLNKFKEINKKSVNASKNHSIFLKLPSLWLDVFAIFGIGILVGTMVMQGRKVDEILPILGLYAVATFRILPTANRLLYNYQLMKFHTPIVEQISSDLEKVRELEGIDHFVSNELSTVQLEFRDINFSYNDFDKNVYEDLNFKIVRGEFVGIIGKSGAGKTTLIDLLSGLLTPDSGEIYFNGDRVENSSMFLKNRIGYVSQSVNLLEDSILHNIALGVELEKIDMAQVKKAIEIAQIDGVISKLEHGIDTLIGEKGVQLSGGQRQRIAIARALYDNPSILIFDEATNSLDTEVEDEIMNAIHRLKGSKTIIMVSHKTSILEECDQVYKIENGKIIKVDRLDEVI